MPQLLNTNFSTKFRAKKEEQKMIKSWLEKSFKALRIYSNLLKSQTKLGQQCIGGLTAYSNLEFQPKLPIAGRELLEHNIL